MSRLSVHAADGVGEMGRGKEIWYTAAFAAFSGPVFFQTMSLNNNAQVQGELPEVAGEGLGEHQEHPGSGAGTIIIMFVVRSYMYVYICVHTYIYIYTHTCMYVGR